MANSSEFCTPLEAAEFLRVSRGTLRNWRAAYTGPLWFRVGPSGIRYKRTDLEDYVEQSQGAKRGHPSKKRETKPKVSTTKLKAKLHRVMMTYHLSSPDLQLVMRAFSVERLRDLQAARHANFVATLVALGERYAAREADARKGGAA